MNLEYKRLEMEEVIMDMFNQKFHEKYKETIEKQRADIAELVLCLKRVVMLMGNEYPATKICTNNIIEKHRQPAEGEK